MNHKKRVLILTAPYGNGHIQPAKAIAEVLETLDIEVSIYDVIDEWNPSLSKLTQNFYKQMYRSGFRRLYQLFYWATDQEIVGDFTSFFLKYSNKSNLNKAIKKINPDTILCTFPTWALYKLLEDFDITIPVETIVTDFYMHKLWYHPSVDRYFVANNWTIESINFSVDKKKFIVTGIPIKNEFENFNGAKSPFQVQNTILLIAGANGVSTNYYQLAKKLYSDYPHLKIILICGRNKFLFRKARKLKWQLKSSRFIVYGYVKDMVTQYAKADLVVTKSGGNTVSELAALSKPAIFLDPLFGQEMANALFFEKQGVAYVAKSILDVNNYINIVYSQPKKLQEMSENYKAFFIPNAAKTIAEYLKDIVYNK